MKTLISLSGGLDSTTLLAASINLGEQCYAISFSYGSKHNKFENEAARIIAEYYKVPFQLIDISSVMIDFKSDLLLTGADIPEGHYNDSSMKRTVVPCRNLIFGSILAGYAQSNKIDQIKLGIHSGDHFIYPDCRPEFFYSFAYTVNKATEGTVRVEAPFLDLDKADIVKIGLELNVPYQLTRTCYKYQQIACGVCGSCNERKEAFALNNAVDPLTYKE